MLHMSVYQYIYILKNQKSAVKYIINIHIHTYVQYSVYSILCSTLCVETYICYDYFLIRTYKLIYNNKIYLYKYTNKKVVYVWYRMVKGGQNYEGGCIYINTIVILIICYQIYMYVCMCIISL